MSAAVREPARTAEVARHYLRLLANGRAALAFVLVLMLALVLSMNTTGFEGVAAMVWLTAYLPLLQWGPADRRGGLDEAMPLGRVRHELVRVACGAAWAAVALSVAIVLVALLFYWGYHGRTHPGFWEAPPLLVALGVAFYLFGSALWLRGANGGLTSPAALAFGVAPVVLLGVGWPRLERLVSLRGAPAPGQALAWAGVAAAWVAAGAAAAWLSASAPPWLPRPWIAAGAGGATPGRWPRRRRAASPARSALPDAAATRRRKTPLHRVLWRAVVLLAPMLGVVAVLVAIALAWMLGGEGSDPGRGPRAVGRITYFFPLWWPTVVWGYGARPSRRLVEALPVGAVTQQLMRLAAGAVWLEVIVLMVLLAPATRRGAGVRPLDPGNGASWEAIAAGALFLYLLASLPALLTREHRLGWYLGWLVFLLPALPMARANLPPGRFSLASALSVFALKADPAGEAMLLWIVLLAGVAVGAAAGGVAIERSAPPGLR